MKLLTKELEKRFQEIGNQSNEPDPVIVAKFFNPCGSQTWLASEYYGQDKTFYGYVTGMGDNEWGYFSLEELQQLKLPLGLSIERDIYTSEKRISEHCPELLERIERLKEMQKIEASKEQSKEQENQR
jgi:hypothetical protein